MVDIVELWENETGLDFQTTFPSPPDDGPDKDNYGRVSRKSTLAYNARREAEGKPPWTPPVPGHVPQAFQSERAALTGLPISSKLTVHESVKTSAPEPVQATTQGPVSTPIVPEPRRRLRRRPPMGQEEAIYLGSSTGGSSTTQLAPSDTQQPVISSTLSVRSPGHSPSAVSGPSSSTAQGTRSTSQKRPLPPIGSSTSTPTSSRPPTRNTGPDPGWEAGQSLQPHSPKLSSQQSADNLAGPASPPSTRADTRSSTQAPAWGAGPGLQPSPRLSSQRSSGKLGGPSSSIPSRRVGNPLNRDSLRGPRPVELPFSERPRLVAAPGYREATQSYLQATQTPVQSAGYAERCSMCRQAGTACTGGRPCRRCQRRTLNCTD